jgi:hypothetical protein
MNEKMKTMLKFSTTMEVWYNSKDNEPKKSQYGDSYTVRVSQSANYKEEDGWRKEYHNITLSINNNSLQSAKIQGYNGLLKITGIIKFSGSKVETEGVKRTVYGSPFFEVNAIEKVDLKKSGSTASAYANQKGGYINESDDVPF